jgi:serine/threonine-protein phosphatase 6 regulatory subunit 3
VLTTVGTITPLTFERYRICELFAELLHCSNMALLNRSSEYDYLYDSEGRLQGGLSALEDLAQVIAMGSGNQGDNDADEGMDEIEPAMELPVHSSVQDGSSLDSDEDMSDGDGPGSFEDDIMEDISISDSPKSTQGRSPLSSSPTHTTVASSSDTMASGASSDATQPSSILDTASSGVAEVPKRKSSSTSIGSTNSAAGRRSIGSRRNSRRLTFRDSSQASVLLPPGERLKKKLLDSNILSTILVCAFHCIWDTLC